MKSSPDPEFTRYKNLDFANAKPVTRTTHLKRLQAAGGSMSRIAKLSESGLADTVRTCAKISGR